VSRFRTAVVTGASHGIGRAIVDELLKRDLQVHAFALADDGFDELAVLPGVTARALDVRDVDALIGALDGIDVDVLVNNAGIIGMMTPVHASAHDVADRLIDINLRAAVHATMTCLPGMVARRYGHVFFTGSIAATRPTANSALYSATKAAVHAFADGLRLDVAGSGVRVTVLAPGRVETNLYDAAFGGHEPAIEKLYTTMQAMSPSDIASLVGVALDLPAHIDVTRLEVVPTGQAFGGVVTT
jgi:NADP-dependent 3-hydroxy acid dehydrogenase YdfG